MHSCALVVNCADHHSSFDWRFFLWIINAMVCISMGHIICGAATSGNWKLIRAVVRWAILWLNCCTICRPRPISKRVVLLAERRLAGIGIWFGQSWAGQFYDFLVHVYTCSFHVLCVLVCSHSSFNLCLGLTKNKKLIIERESIIMQSPDFWRKLFWLWFDYCVWGNSLAVFGPPSRKCIGPGLGLCGCSITTLWQAAR